MDRIVFRRVLWAAVPAIAALVVYAATLNAAFVYDDELLIRKNRWVQDPSVLTQLPLKPLLASPPAGTTNYYRPVVVVLYNAMWQSLSGRPLAFHLLNVLVHMLNATLVLRLVCRITGAQDVTAVGAALLFAVHPLNTEVVAWASGLPELTYTAFGLSAVVLHVVSWGLKDGPARRYRVMAWALFALACLCKETALAFLPLLALLELWLRPGRSRDPRARWRAAGRSLAPYLGAVALVFAARTAVLGGFIPRGVHRSLTLGDAVLNAPWLLLLYVKSMLVPSPLVVEHIITLVKSVTDPRFLLSALLVASAIAAIWRLRTRLPELAFAACLTIVPLLPALYLPGLGRDPFAERYAYLGVAGMCWLVIGGVDALSRRGRPVGPRWLLPALVGALAIVAGARTVARTSDWHDDGSLGRATMREEPRAPIGYLLLGSWHVREGRKEDALHDFEDGVAHAQDNAELQVNAIALGVELGRLSTQESVAAYERLAPLAPTNASVPYNLGQVLLQAGRREEAQTAFLRSLELAPASVPAMTALAVIASQNGDAASSVRLCREALAIDPHSTPALQQLGVALMRTGDIPGAVAALERAVAIDPADKESLNRLGVAYARAGRLDDARGVWERALAIDPNFAGALQNLERLRRTPR